MLFEREQNLSAIIPNNFTTLEAGILSNAELTKFWSVVLFTKHSDTALKFLGKAISYDFSTTSEEHPVDFYSTPERNRFNHYNVLTVGLHDHFFQHCSFVRSRLLC